MTLNGGYQTSSYVCSELNLQEPCGDADGCTIRVVVQDKTDANDKVQMVDENIFMEQTGISGASAANGVYGYTRQSGGGTFNWVSNNGTRDTIAAPFSWAWIYDYKNYRCYSYTPLLPAYTFSFMTHPHVYTQFFIYD